MQGLYDSDNAALPPGWMVVAQNAMRNLENYRGHEELDAALNANVRQETATRNGGGVPPGALISAAASTLQPAPGAQWVYIHFEGRKLRVPADSLEKWRAVDPNTVILDVDAS